MLNEAGVAAPTCSIISIGAPRTSRLARRRRFSNATRPPPSKRPSAAAEHRRLVRTSARAATPRRRSRALPTSARDDRRSPTRSDSSRRKNSRWWFFHPAHDGRPTRFSASPPPSPFRRAFGVFGREAPRGRYQKNAAPQGVCFRRRPRRACVCCATCFGRDVMRVLRVLLPPCWRRRTCRRSPSRTKTRR